MTRKEAAEHLHQVKRGIVLRTELVSTVVQEKTKEHESMNDWWYPVVKVQEQIHEKCSEQSEESMKRLIRR